MNGHFSICWLRSNKRVCAVFSGVQRVSVSMLWWHDMSHVTELWVPPSRSLVMRQLLPFITDTHHLCLLVTGIVFTWLNIVTIIHFQWAWHYYCWFSSWLTQHWPVSERATLSVDMLMGEGGSREWSGAGEGWMLDDAPLTPEAPFITCHPLHKYKQRIRVTFPWPRVRSSRENVLSSLPELMRVTLKASNVPNPA